MKYLTKIIVVATGLILFSCDKESTDSIAEKPDLIKSLSFKNIIEIESNHFEDQMSGFLANPSENSLYISCRNKSLINTETTYKITLNDLKLISKNVSVMDFVTKRNHIYNNQLCVLGGSGITTYNLDLTVNKNYTRYPDNRSFSRFGSVINNENVFFVGGGLGGEDPNDPNFDKKLWKYSLQTSLFTLQANMPKNRNGSSAEIVNNKIYSFFGYENTKSGTTAPTIQLLNDVQIYDLNSNSFQAMDLAKNVKVSFTAKYENYIFVAGNKIDGSLSSAVNGSFFGYFDTRTNMMTEIPITVENNNLDFPYICEIEIMNNKIYALVKNSSSAFSIQVANLK